MFTTEILYSSLGLDQDPVMLSLQWSCILHFYDKLIKYHLVRISRVLFLIARASFIAIFPFSLYIYFLLLIKKSSIAIFTSKSQNITSKYLRIIIITSKAWCMYYFIFDKRESTPNEGLIPTPREPWAIWTHPFILHRLNTGVARTRDIWFIIWGKYHLQCCNT